MGCCHSTNADSQSADHVDNDDWRREHERRDHRQQRQQGLASSAGGAGGPNAPQSPNAPIRPPSPLARSPKNVSNRRPPWTRSHLERERRVYFETRVSGNREAWDTLQVVSEHLREGRLQEAQGILDAAGFTCPDGRFARTKGRKDPRTGMRTRIGGVYDDSGFCYEVPEWCVTDPLDLVEEDDHGPEAEKDIEVGASSDGTGEDSDKDNSAGVQDRGPARHKSRGEKGKGRADDIGEEISVKARMSNALRDIEITMGSKQPVRVAAQRICEKAGVRKVRLIYLGKDLNEAKSLEAQGWDSKHMLNAFAWENTE